MIGHVQLPLAVGMMLAVRGFAYPPPDTPPLYPERHPFQVIQCFVDIGQGTYSIVETATNLWQATLLCPQDQTREEKLQCSASLGNMMEALLYMISYLMDGLTDCLNTTIAATADVACAADITGFLNGIATAWGSASSLASGDCVYQKGSGSGSLPAPGQHMASGGLNVPVGPGLSNINAPQKIHNTRVLLNRKHQAAPVQAAATLPASELPEFNQYKFLRHSVADYNQTIRDLHGKLDELAHKAALNDNEKMFCFIASGQAPMYLLRAIVAFRDSAELCPTSQTQDESGKIMCTVTLANLLGALYYTAVYTTIIVSNCPAPDDQKAICANDILSVLTVFTSLIGSGARFPLSCGAIPDLPVVPSLMASPNTSRRLANSSRTPSVFV